MSFSFLMCIYLFFITILTKFTSVDIFFAVSIAKRKELFNMNLPQ